jgi:hypothetical protein
MTKLVSEIFSPLCAAASYAQHCSLQTTESGVGAWYDLSKPLTKVTLPAASREVPWVQINLAKYGYPCQLTNIVDTGTTRAVKAFQLHCRPTNISGEIDTETIRILASLVDRYIDKDDKDDKKEEKHEASAIPRKAAGGWCQQATSCSLQ